MGDTLGKLINIGSSSEGNSFFIEIKLKEFEKPFGLLLDCGFKYEKIANALSNYGVGMQDVNAVLVTHKHGDHSKAVKEMVERGKRVFAPLTVFNFVGLKVEDRFVIKSLMRKTIASGLSVLPIPLDHQDSDGSLCENYGYIIDIENEFRIIYITDTKYIAFNLRNYKADLIIVESNFDIRMLKIAIEDTKGYDGKRFERNLESHFSVQHAAKWLSNLDLSKTKTIVLMHLSSNSKNAQPFKFKKIVEDKLVSVGKTKIPRIIVAKMDGGFE